MSSLRQLQRFGLIAAVLLAVVLRVEYFREVRSSPFFEHPVFDARDYAAWAQEIAGGNIVWDEPKLYPPGYPYLLAVLSRLTGHSLPLMTYANGLLGCAWIVLLVLAVRRLFPPPTAELAGIVAAAYWVFFHFEAHLVAETWFIFLDVLALYLLAVAAGASGSRATRLVLAGGVALGLATITRPNALASLPFLLPLVVLAPSRPPTFRTAALRTLPLVVGFAIVLAPVMVRNHQLTGMFAVRHHLAFNLYLGNRPGAPGYHTIRPGREWDRLSEEPERVAGAHTLADHERYFTDRVVSFVREDPGAFLRLQLRKALLFFNERELRDIMSPYFFDRFAPLQASRFLPSFGWVGPPALVGLFLALRARRRWLLYAFAIPQAATVIFTVVGTRYRLPVVPFLIPFAAYTLVRLGSQIAERRIVPAAATLGALAAATIVVHHRFPDLQHDTFAEEMTRVALVREEEGDLDGAAGWWTQALEADPERAETWVGYAALALRAGDLPRAEEATRAGLSYRPGDFDLLSLRGHALLLLGAPDSARAALEAALAERPDDVDALADLARSQSDLGDVDASIDAFRKAIRLDGRRVDVMLDAARVLTDAANSDTTTSSGHEERRRLAVGILEQVLAREPSNAEAQAMLEEAREAPVKSRRGAAP